jgi:hypothetical protein
MIESDVSKCYVLELTVVQNGLAPVADFCRNAVAMSTALSCFNMWADYSPCPLDPFPRFLSCKPLSRPAGLRQ